MAEEYNLIDAVTEDDIESVAELIADGADVNASDNTGRTPLHEAAGIGLNEMVELLVTNGADVNAEDNEGFTPLHVAANGHFTKIAELLIAEGADVNAKNNIGLTPLDVAELAATVFEIEPGSLMYFAEVLNEHGAEESNETKKITIEFLVKELIELIFYRSYTPFFKYRSSGVDVTIATTELDVLLLFFPFVITFSKYPDSFLEKFKNCLESAVYNELEGNGDLFLSRWNSKKNSTENETLVQLYITAQTASKFDIYNEMTKIISNKIGYRYDGDPSVAFQIASAFIMTMQDRLKLFSYIEKNYELIEELG